MKGELFMEYSRLVISGLVARDFKDHKAARNVSLMIEHKIGVIARHISKLLGTHNFPKKLIRKAFANLYGAIEVEDPYALIESLLWALDISITRLAEYHLSIGKKGIPPKDIPGIDPSRAFAHAKLIAMAKGLVPRMDAIPLNPDLF